MVHLMTNLAMVFDAPKNVTTFPQMLQYINGLTDATGNGGVIGILILLVIGASLFMMIKGYGTEKAFGVTGLVLFFLSVFLKVMLLIPSSVMYICIFIGVFGIIMLLKEAARYE